MEPFVPGKGFELSYWDHCVCFFFFSLPTASQMDFYFEDRFRKETLGSVNDNKGSDAALSGEVCH